MTDLCAKGSKPDYPAQAPISSHPLAGSMASCQGGRTSETPIGAKPGCSGSSAQTPIIDVDLELASIKAKRVKRWVTAGDAFVQALFERHELQQQQVNDLLDMIDTFEPKEDGHV